MLKGKTVILGVTGSIAAYKMANVASMLVKQHCNVHVIMTKNATNFINPIAFETLTSNKCLVDTFDRNFQFNVQHVSLAKQADAFLIAPASANIIAKMAYGLADDMLSTTILACTCPKLVAPAMNTNMYRNPIVQENLQKLERFGFTVIRPATGMLACRDVGEGKLPAESVLMDYIFREIGMEKDLAGLKVLVTAGPTREALDPVRYLTNHSSGKMGYAVARDCMLRGADVTLVSGPTAIEPPPFVQVVDVVSARDMYEAVLARSGEADIIVKAAAVADYRPAVISSEKMKKGEGEMTIPLARTQDILGALGEKRKPGQFLCGFSMETQDMVENSRKKLEKKKIQMIAANNLKVEGAGFQGDTNQITIITPHGQEEMPLMSKEETAHALMSRILAERRELLLRENLSD